jgi:hypothetical protein
MSRSVGPPGRGGDWDEPIQDWRVALLVGDGLSTEAQAPGVRDIVFSCVKRLVTDRTTNHYRTNMARSAHTSVQLISAMLQSTVAARNVPNNSNEHQDKWDRMIPSRRIANVNCLQLFTTVYPPPILPHITSHSGTRRRRRGGVIVGMPWPVA